VPLQQLYCDVTLISTFYNSNNNNNNNNNSKLVTLCAKLSGTVHCNRSCLWVCVCVCVCLWVCYHDNSKLRASIFTKLGLYVKVVTISSWLNFGRPAPPGRGLRRGENFWLRLTTASAQCLRLSERFLNGPLPGYSGWASTMSDKNPLHSLSLKLGLYGTVENSIIFE